MILVTGGTGLVGSHLLLELVKEGQSVVAIHRKSSSLEMVKKVFSYYEENYQALYDKIQWIEADINDLTALGHAFKGIRRVYHAAALISFDPKDYKLLRKVNIEGTANICNLCISNGIDKLCFVSSVAAIGKPIKGNEITEDNEWNVADNNYGYAITKFGAEMEVWRATQEGLNVVIVNPGVIIGPGYWETGSGTLFSKIAKGFKFYSLGITGFVGIKDTVKIMHKLMESELINQRYILVSENASFKDVLFSIADDLGQKRPYIKASYLLGEIAWRLEWLRSKFTGKTPILTKHSVRSSGNAYHFSNAKISKALSYTFEPLTKSIRETSHYFKNG